MTRKPYESVEVSRSEPGEIEDPPANGEAIGVKMYDPFGDYEGYLIEWQGNPDTWISADNNVSLSEKV